MQYVSTAQVYAAWLVAIHCSRWGCLMNGAVDALAGKLLSFAYLKLRLTKP